MLDPHFMDTAAQLRKQFSALKQRMGESPRRPAQDDALYREAMATMGRLLDLLASGVAPDGSAAEDAAEQSDARLGAVVNTAVDAIITIDQAGTIESINPSTETMFGFTADELIGRNVKLLMPAPYRDEHDEYLRRYLTTGEKRIIGIGREIVGRRKDGSVFPIDLAVSEFTIHGRRMFTGIIRDITDRKELERQVLDTSTQEQQRIGADLHDGLGQELTGIAFLTGVLQKNLAAKGLPHAGDAAEIVSLVNQTIDHTRALVRGLCPVKLEAEGLMIALEQLAEDVKDVHSLRCRFECPRPVPIRDHTTATHLYYIANEAVNNALRHARPRRIDITLTAAGSRGALSVRDDGVGVKPSDPVKGRGMHLMRYRARTIGGALEVVAPARGGTEVVCTFDLSKDTRNGARHDPTQSPAADPAGS